MSQSNTVKVINAGRPAEGAVRVPGDKSLSHRTLLFAALAEGTTKATGLGSGADVQGTRAALEALGVSITDEGKSVVIEGRGHDALKAPASAIDCGNSGTTMRLLAGVFAGAQLEGTLDGDASLRGRPMARILDPLRAMGAECEGAEGDRAPLRFTPAQLRGREHELEVASAQVLSCLVLAGLYADGPTTVKMPPGGRDHTERMLKAMGATLEHRPGFARVEPLTEPLKPLGEIVVPRDPSSAAFFVAAAMVLKGGAVVLPGVSLNPTRTGFLDAVEKMGGQVERQLRDETTLGEPVGNLRVYRDGALSPIQIDASQVPAMVDELPVLAVLAALANGVSEIRGAKELRVKESDRIAAVTKGLRALGADLDEHEDGWTIRGGQPLGGGAIDAEKDHRVAMSFAVAALATREPVTLSGAQWVETSYPTFFDDLAKVSFATLEWEDA